MKRSPLSRRGVIAVGALILSGAGVVSGRLAIPRSVAPGVQPDGSVRLASGWKITPAGSHEMTEDMLIGSALSPDKKTLALVSAGYGRHTLNIVDTTTGSLVQQIPLLQAWNGVVWSPDGKAVYVSGGASPSVHVVTKNARNEWEASNNLLFQPANDPAPVYIAGLALSRDGDTLYVANIATDRILALRLPEGNVVKSRALTPGARPYCLRRGPDNLLYVTEWASSRVVVLDPKTLETARTLTVGSHPNDLAFSKDGRLFVSCGNDDVVDVVDPQSGNIAERIRTALTPRSPAGATPCALSLAPDERTLYVANADNNDVAAIDIAQPGRSRVRGFIPTGWYPTAVCALPDGRRLLIGSGKGMGTAPNRSAAVKPDSRTQPRFKFIGSMLKGMLSTLPVPGDRELAAYTAQVLANTPFTGDVMIANPALAPVKEGANAIPSRLGNPSPIKHILYIIKENRTYDQVFGDLGKGNGDPSLTLFGEQVTPNQHALARQFVLLDNVYCNGEVSADGHPWSDGALVTDFTQRTWPVSYSGKGEPPATERLTVPPAGYIWDRCSQKGLSYRSYGEYTFAASGDAPPGALGSSDGATSLKGHASRAWEEHRQKNRDWEKADIFIEELHGFERGNNLPNFMVMSLGENHTRGTQIGAFTPKACVASNDVGLGKIVAACTKSKYWKEMAIFVIEDDAQNGPDHVDAHRTAALVISPYTRRGIVDSTFYTTASFLRTMELVLGLAPMSQYDAAATPLYAAFSASADLSGFTALPARIDLNARNGRTAFGASRMARIDFSEYDHLTVDDEDALNRALWASVKGASTPYPASVRGALFTSAAPKPARTSRPRRED